MTSNIERFDELTGQLLGTLYDRFPIGTVLNRDDYHGVTADTTDWFERFSGANAFFCSTVHWLQRAGYIDYSMKDGGTFYDAVLTAKGLQALKAMPASLDPKKTVGEYIAEGAQAGAVEAVKKGVAYVLSTGSVLAWNALTTTAGS